MRTLTRTACGLALSVAMLGGCSSNPGSDDAGAEHASPSASAGPSAPTSSTSPSATSAARPTAPTGDQICSMVSDSAVKTIVGSVPPKPISGSANGMTECEWEGDQDYKLAVSAGSSAQLATAVGFQKKNSTASVDGLGDEAFVANGYSTSGGGSARGATLYIVSGPVTYYVAGVSDGVAPSVDDLEVVGQEVLKAG